MKLKNIALTAAQVSVSAAAGVVVLPGVIAMTTISGIAYTSKAAEKIGGVALSKVYFAGDHLVRKLESMKA